MHQRSSLLSDCPSAWSTAARPSATGPASAKPSANARREGMGFVPRGDAGRYNPSTTPPPVAGCRSTLMVGLVRRVSASAPKMPAHGARDYRPTGSGMAEQKTLPGS